MPLSRGLHACKERLKRCLRSVSRSGATVVYVDSGSTDGSVEWTRALGVHVVELDMRSPFTAARARNAGYRRLRAQVGSVRYVQFVDGDCELDARWLEAAAAFLDERRDVGVVSGRLRERYPGLSVYNLLCDIEWDAPIGEAKFCGGVAMMRCEALDAVGGFREDLVAGEEPELCVRLRAAGWKIWRIEEDMAVHDAAMTRFGQWWKRTMRGGFAFAQGMALHGAPPERLGVRPSLRIWLWAFGIPVGVLVLACLRTPCFFLLLLAYPVQIFRLALRGSRSPRENVVHAAFLVLAKFPEMLGQFKFAIRWLRGKPSGLFEYK